MEWQSGESKTAVALLRRRTCSIWKESDRSSQAFLFARLATLASKYGDVNQGILWLDQAQRLLDISELDAKFKSIAFDEILHAISASGDPKRAAPYTDKMRSVAYTMDHPTNIASMLAKLAQAAESVNAHDMAKKLLDEAQRSAVKIDSLSRRADLLHEWKQLATKLHGEAYGQAMFKRSRQAAESSGSKLYQSYSLTDLAATAFEHGDFRQGIEMFEQASRIAFFDQLRGLRTIALRLKDDQLAIQLLRKVRDNIDASDRHEWAKNTEWKGLALDFARRGLFEEARVTIKRITRLQDKAETLIEILTLDENVH